MKQCRKCGRTKHEEEFGRNRTRLDGLSHWCKACRRTQYHIAYAKNRAAIAARSARSKEARREVLRKRYFDYLATHPCVDCGIANPVVLELDHVRGEKHFNVSTRMLRATPAWETILEEIAKCEVRCANCHRIRTAEQFGYKSLMYQESLGVTAQSRSEVRP